MHRGFDTELLDAASFILGLVQLDFLSQRFVGIPWNLVVVDVRHFECVYTFGRFFEYRLSCVYQYRATLRDVVLFNLVRCRASKAI